MVSTLCANKCIFQKMFPQQNNISAGVKGIVVNVIFEVRVGQVSIVGVYSGWRSACPQFGVASRNSSTEAKQCTAVFSHLKKDGGPWLFQHACFKMINI